MTQTCLSRIARAALAAVAFGTAAATLSAQAGTGRLEGRVLHDSTRAAIADARVIVVGSAWLAAVDSLGKYHFGAIPAGVYSVRATYVGYRPYQFDSIRVVAGRTTRLDFVLVPVPATVVYELGLSGSSKGRP